MLANNTAVQHDCKLRVLTHFKDLQEVLKEFSITVVHIEASTHAEKHFWGQSLER